MSSSSPFRYAELRSITLLYPHAPLICIRQCPKQSLRCLWCLQGSKAYTNILSANVTLVRDSYSCKEGQKNSCFKSLLIIPDPALPWHIKIIAIDLIALQPVSIGLCATMRYQSLGLLATFVYLTDAPAVDHDREFEISFSLIWTL